MSHSSKDRNVNLRLPFSVESTESRATNSERGLGRRTDLIVEEVTSQAVQTRADQTYKFGSRSYNTSGRTSPRFVGTKTVGDLKPGHRTEDVTVELLKGLVKDKTMKIDDLKLENELLKSKIDVISRERCHIFRDSLVQDYHKLKTRVQNLLSQLTDYKAKFLRYKDLTLFLPTPDLLQRAENYSDFILLKMKDFPGFEHIFKERAGSIETFASLIHSQNHFSALLICLQVLCDLMVVQADNSFGKETFKPTESSISDIGDLPISPIGGASDVHSFVSRVEDEYEKMMDESKSLRSKIDHQSLRIATLSHQLSKRLGPTIEGSASHRPSPHRHPDAHLYETSVTPDMYQRDSSDVQLQLSSDSADN